MKEVCFVLFGWVVSVITRIFGRGKDRGGGDYVKMELRLRKFGVFRGRFLFLEFREGV